MSEGEIQGKEQNELTEQERRAKDLFFQSLGSDSSKLASAFPRVLLSLT
jgi:hypothetical protein